MHPQLNPLTIGGTVLKEFDDLVILGVTFDSKITVKKHLHSVSRAASQRLGILMKSWRVFHNRSFLRRCFRGFVLPFRSTVLQSGAQLPIPTLNYWTVRSVVPIFELLCPFSNSINITLPAYSLHQHHITSQLPPSTSHYQPTPSINITLPTYSLQ